MNSLKRTISAEDLACAKEYIQSRMFSGIMPVYEWDNIVDEYLGEHPNLACYRPVMIDIIRRARVSHRLIKQIAAYYKRQNNAAIDGSLPSQEIRSRNIRDLFRNIFEKEPLGRVECIEGCISLTFVVDREDFDRVYMSKHVFPAAGTVMQWKDVPILLVLRNSNAAKSPWSVSLSTMTHEAEHVNNLVFRAARGWCSGTTIRHNILLSGHQELVCKLRKIEKDNVLIEECAKDEILAYFTEIEFYDAIQDRADAKSKNFIQIKLSRIKKELCSDKGYYGGYCKQLNPDKKTGKRYFRNVKMGINAIADLREFYKDAGIEHFDRLAMNVLEQFPLCRWPAVVRLIKSQNRRAD